MGRRCWKIRRFARQKRLLQNAVTTTTAWPLPCTKLSTKEWKSSKIDTFLSTLTVADWATLDKLCDAFLSANRNVTSSNKAKSIIMSTFSRIASKSFDLPLQLYCERLKAYLDKKQVSKEFHDIYSRHVETIKQQNESERLQQQVLWQDKTNATKSELVGAKLVKRPWILVLRVVNQILSRNLNLAW